jgi:ABC-2 type transport system ATP-binding protein
MLFKFNNVNKNFARDFWQKDFVALENVSFQMNKGCITGFLGANGAGKTTSLRILLKLIKPSSGTIDFAPELGTKGSEIFKKIGFLPERPYFYPNLTGQEFLIYMGMLAGVKKSDLPIMIKHWTERLNIAFALNRKLRTYSKGMLQRVGFASTCLHRPELLILDEPLSGLDPIGRKEFKDAMIELSKEGKSIFFSSHIVSDVEEICQEVVILEHGKLIYSGGINSFIRDNSRNFFELKIIKSSEIIPDEMNKYISFENNELYLFKIPMTDKEKVLKYFMDNINSIYSMVPEKPTLEEVVYKIRSYESRS